MAESILLHFRDATGPQIFSALSSRCEKAIDRVAYFYPNNAAYVLLVSEYSGYAVEYESEEKARVESALGRRPSFSLEIELRRSRQEAACDAAQEMVSQLCVAYDVVMDDCHRLWTLREIQDTDDLLRVYRNKGNAQR